MNGTKCGCVRVEKHKMADDEQKNAGQDVDALKALLGDEVVDGSGNKMAVGDIAKSNVAIGIYFSAHWYVLHD